MPNFIYSQHESTTVGQPFNAEVDVNHMQYALRDNTAIIAESIIGVGYDDTKTYILKGCKISSSGGTTTIAPGYVFGIKKAYGGMVTRTYAYFHPGSSFADPGGGDVVVCKTTETFIATDPTLFTDTTTHYIHAVINVAFSAGASGSGDVDYSDLVPCLNEYQPGGNITATPDAGSITSVATTYNYFRLNGDQLNWDLKFTATLAGGVSVVSIDLPNISTGYGWTGHFANHPVTTQVFNQGDLMLGTGNINRLDLTLPALATFPDDILQEFNVNLTARII